MTPPNYPGNIWVIFAIIAGALFAAGVVGYLLH
jgi:hypothetical protein